MADMLYDPAPDLKVIVEKQRYFDGVVRTVDGKDVTLAQQKLAPSDTQSGPPQEDPFRRYLGRVSRPEYAR